MPQHGGFDALHLGRRHFDRLKHPPLLGTDCREASEVLAGRQSYAVALNRARPVQQLLRGDLGRRNMRAATQRALDHQAKEADEPVRPVSGSQKVWTFWI